MAQKISEETRKKMSESAKKRISFGWKWKNGHSKEAKEKISETCKLKGVGKWMAGRKLSKEVCEKIGNSMIGNQHNVGKKLTEEHKNNISKSHKGRRPKNSLGWVKEGHPFWKGGISFEKYPEGWTICLRESIRKRDSYICFMCKIKQEELNEKLHIHHIDYNKKNLDPNNLISLCRKCHMKTNYKREEWTDRFKFITNKK